MEEQQSVNNNFLFIITKAVKVFYETPVIFFTRKDFSDTVFNTYCVIRKAILEEASKNEIADAVTEFHLEWLRAVNEIELFKERMKHISREEVYESIEYTIDSLCTRRKYFQRYIEKYHPALPNEENAFIRTELEIIEDMHKETVKMHVEQLKCFKDHSCDTVFQCKMNEAVEDLLLWLDKINDGLALEISEIINYKRSMLSGDLTKILQRIVYDLSVKKSESYQKIVQNLEQKGRRFGSMVRGVTGHSLEISKINQKIQDIDEQLKSYEEEEQPSAVEALENKRNYLQDRLASLENIRISLKQFNDTHDVMFKDEEEEVCTCEDFYEVRIFNHLLPRAEREKLITDLCYMWGVGILGQAARKRRSVISILSATETKEIFNDELGTFTIDEFSRKIYTKPEDATKYQVNEKHELVPLSDDSEHIYYYDECGRYFIEEENRGRVYKAHETASEYMIDAKGCLIKTKEVKGGVTYYFDNVGRYYIDDCDGKRIYQENNGASEYEADGFGNLVRIRQHPKFYDTCPDGPFVTEDFRYIKRNVGDALKKCIANTVCLQPEDPIKFLATALIKYRKNQEDQCERQQEREELEVERAIKAAEEQAERERLALEAALRELHAGGEATPDTNMASYTHMGLIPDGN